MTGKPKGKSIFDAMGLDDGAAAAPVVPAPTAVRTVIAAAKPAQQVISGKPLEVPLSAVAADPNQPRRSFDPEKLEALAASIREVGVLQPVIVRRDGEDRFIVIDGERRMRASVLADLEKLPVLVRDDFDQEETRRLYVQTICNNHSLALSDLETARVVERLTREGFKKGEFAAELGIQPNRVSGYLAMLESDVLPHVESGTIGSARVAGVFATLDGEGKGRALRMASENGGVMTVRIAESARNPEPAAGHPGDGDAGAVEGDAGPAPSGKAPTAPKPSKAPTSVKLQLSVEGLRRLADTLGDGEAVDVVLPVVRAEAMVGELGSHIDPSEEDLGSRLRDLLNAG